MNETRKTRALRLAGRGVWWLTVRAVRGAAVAAVVAGWVTWVWLSGARWTRTPRRQYVTRPVRATGNWLVTVLVAGVVAAPLVTVVVLTVAGVGLLAAASATRLRRPVARPAGGPIRVQAHIDRPLVTSRR